MIPDTQDQMTPPDSNENVQATPAESQPAPEFSAAVPEVPTIEQIETMMPQPETSSAADVVRRAMEEEARKQAERDAIRQQAESAAAVAAAKPKVVHVVVSGDTLSDIAAKSYGNANKWYAIYEANKDVIGDNPNLIQIGQELVIPEL
jgi:nucleoid-associated protein YgaU